MVNGAADQFLAGNHKRIRRGRDRESRFSFAATERIDLGDDLPRPLARHRACARLSNQAGSKLDRFQS
jgi:hypothetical protein